MNSQLGVLHQSCNLSTWKAEERPEGYIVNTRQIKATEQNPVSEKQINKQKECTEYNSA